MRYTFTSPSTVVFFGDVQLTPVTNQPGSFAVSVPADQDGRLHLGIVTVPPGPRGVSLTRLSRVVDKLLTPRHLRG